MRRPHNKTKLCDVNSSYAARAYYAPTLVLSLVCLAFGFTTVFWQVPTINNAALVFAVYLLGMAAASLFHANSSGKLTDQNTEASIEPRSIAQVWRSLAMIQAAGGVFLAVRPYTELWLTLTGSLILGISGVMILLLGLRAKNTLPTDKDWRIAGIVTTAAALMMPLVSDLGAKALLGVSGGAALIVGIFMLIGALTLRSMQAEDSEN